MDFNSTAILSPCGIQIILFGALRNSLKIG